LMIWLQKTERWWFGVKQFFSAQQLEVLSEYPDEPWEHGLYNSLVSVRI
jgi:hypothetical protein